MIKFEIKFDRVTNPLRERVCVTNLFIGVPEGAIWICMADLPLPSDKFAADLGIALNTSTPAKYIVAALRECMTYLRGDCDFVLLLT